MFQVGRPDLDLCYFQGDYIFQVFLDSHANLNLVLYNHERKHLEKIPDTNTALPSLPNMGNSLHNFNLAPAMHTFRFVSVKDLQKKSIKSFVDHDMEFGMTSNELNKICSFYPRGDEISFDFRLSINAAR